MTNSSLELDMFGNNDHHDAPARQLPPPMERRNSIRGIQTAIMKIDPQLLRSLSSSFSFAPAPAPLNTNPAGWVSCPSSPLPLPTSSSTSVNGSIPVETSPLSILYNGTVTVVDLPRDKADAIIKLAKESSVTNGGGGVAKKREVGEKDDEDLPIARRKSLQLFLQKRKERFSAASAFPRSNNLQPLRPLK